MPTKSALIAALRQLATLLEIDGANSFKVNAYVRAAQLFADEDIDIAAAVENDTLTDIPGIGSGIAEKIRSFWTDGTIGELEALREKFPEGLVQMTEIPGFGAKKARAVFDELGIASVEELARACQDGRVAALKGFGARTAEKILAGIEQMRRHSGRHRIDVAHAAAMPILEALRPHKAVERVEVAGSLRRWRETIKDLDFVCATKDSDKVMDFFVSLPGVASIVGKGSTKTSVLLDSGMQADLRCVEPAQFPFALQHFTGSREHNTALRARAKEMGLKSNEYGLFKEGSEKSLKAADEAAIYKHLGLAYIEPELRESNGEIEAAEAGKLPRLVTRDDIRGIMHMHTKYSDGHCDAEDYAKWAVANKIEWMGITDHSKTAAYAGGLKVDAVRRQWEELGALDKKYARKGVRLLKGIESDILADGALDYDDETLAGFDFIVASIHSRMNLDQEQQTARLLRTVENPFTTIIGHMTGRLLLQRDPIKIDQHEVLRHCARHNVIVEINADPHRLDVDWRMLRFAVEEGCLISIGPDAHLIAGLDNMRYGIGIARKGWVPPDRLVNRWSAEEFLDHCRKKRSAGASKKSAPKSAKKAAKKSRK